MMIAIPALLGLILCLLNAAGADLFCLTTGCTLYAGYSLFGLSFYVYGAFGFGVMAILALIARIASGTVTLLGVTILSALVIDALFLGWQILYWPCLSCLVVALLLGATAVGFRRGWPEWRPKLIKGVLIIWTFLLIPVAVAAGKEVLLSPWVMHGSPKASVRVFFSPSCPTCATEVVKLLKSPEGERAAFVPIAKNERDVRLLATLLQDEIAGSADLASLFQDDLEEHVDPPLLLRWRLARNKMALASLGVQTIPLILSQTVMEVSRQPDYLLTVPGSRELTEPDGCGAFDPQETSCE